jgi:hypothetical protein
VRVQTTGFQHGIAARGGPAESDREEHADADAPQYRHKDRCR